SVFSARSARADRYAELPSVRHSPQRPHDGLIVGAPPAHGADRRSEIPRSAAAAFRRRGYHGASVDEIASALEMTKGNLYYYFKNKEEILFACHEYSLDKLLVLMADVEAQESTPDAKLRKLVLAFVHLILDDLHGTAL